MVHSILLPLSWLCGPRVYSCSSRDCVLPVPLLQCSRVKWFVALPPIGIGSLWGEGEKVKWHFLALLQRCFPLPQDCIKSTHSSRPLIFSVITWWDSQRKSSKMVWTPPISRAPKGSSLSCQCALGLHPFVNCYSWVLPVGVQQHLVSECLCLLSPWRCLFLFSVWVVVLQPQFFNRYKRVMNLKLF